MNGRRIMAVVVTYFPRVGPLRTNLSLLTGLGLRVAWFDNTPAPPGEAASYRDELRYTVETSGIDHQAPGENLGLSRAYNSVVARYLADPEIDGFLFIDQDSTLIRESLARLISSFYRLLGRGDLGVVGGLPLRQGMEPYGSGIMEGIDLGVEGCHPCGLVISSFSVVPRAAFLRIGAFQDDFFIDHLDVDLCRRLRRAGLMTVIDRRAPFPHPVGYGEVRLLGRLLTPLSRPFRHYYQVRNSILSHRRMGGGPLGLLAEIAKRFAAVLIQCLAGGSARERCGYALRGLVDGMRGRGGPLPDPHPGHPSRSSWFKGGH